MGEIGIARMTTPEGVVVEWTHVINISDGDQERGPIKLINELCTELVRCGNKVKRIHIEIEP